LVAIYLASYTTQLFLWLDMDEAYQHSDLTIMPSYTLFTRGFM